MRRLVAISRCFSLAICLGLLLLWWRSHHTGDWVRWGGIDVQRQQTTWTRIRSARGTLALVRDVLTAEGRVSPERLRATLPQGTHLASGRCDRDEELPLPPGQSRTRWHDWGFALETTRDAGPGMTYDVPKAELQPILVVSSWLVAAVPHWLVAALAFLPMLTIVPPALRARRAKRRRRWGECEHCGYDLRASSERCPECGMAIDAPALPARSRRRLILRCALWAGVLGAVAYGVRFLLELHKSNGVPTWMGLAEEPTAVSDRLDDTQVLKLALEPRWFTSPRMHVSQQECVAFLRRDHYSWGRFRYAINGDLPLLPPAPVTPAEIPLDDHGVRLSLRLAHATEPGELTVMLCLSSASRRVMSETTGSFPPFLFAAYVDGHPITRSPESMRLHREQQPKILVEPGGTHQWSLRVDETSVRSLLPDQDPHTLALVAAFSNRTHTAAVGIPDLSPYIPMRLEPPLLLRSEPALLRWDGKRWTVMAKEGGAGH
ncbi:MAG: hypothetical protein ACHRHE_13610 [Tepidisphaerales bacterium]